MLSFVSSHGYKRNICDAAGEYIGFDEEQPTCRDNGKAVVIQQLKDKFGYHRLVHIGDGVTDLEACPPAVRLQSFPLTLCQSFLIRDNRDSGCENQNLGKVGTSGILTKGR